MMIPRFVSVPDRFTYYWLGVIYFISAMGAYQVFSIPLEWIGSIMAVVSFVFVLHKGGKLRGLYLYLLLFVLFIYFISVLGWWYWSIYIDFADLLPPGATTDYYMFVFLRYLKIFVFAAICFLSVEYLEKNGLQRLADTVIFCGVVVSVYAIYVYIAQIYGLPEITRSRIGTGGESQPVTFTYAFHRAMGSFREPSHLAQWLVLPFFMTFLSKSYWHLAARITILFVILVTGSLTGIIAIIAGYLFAMLIAFPFYKGLVSTLKFAVILLIAGSLFYLIVLPNKGGSIDILAVLADRLIPILQNGIEASNRGHVYEYVYHHSIPLMGYGFGNANLLIGEYMGLGLVGSFLSLYLNMLYSLGYLGFIFAVIFLCAPLFLLLRYPAACKDHLFVLLGAYVGWLLIYAVLSEELTVSFGIIYAACMHYYVRMRKTSLLSLSENKLE